MTILNPTPIVQPVTATTVNGTDQADQLKRLRMLAAEVRSRHAAGTDDNSATAYVFRGEQLGL